MPSLMNCPHKGDSHCLECVKAEWDRREAEKSDLLAALIECRRMILSGTAHPDEYVSVLDAAIARAEGGAA